MHSRNPISKRPTLTQNTFLADGKIKWHWVFFAVLLPIFALVVSLGTAPDSEAKDLPIRIVTSEVTLPLPTIVQRQDEVFWQVDQVRRDDTLSILFDRLGIRDDNAMKYLMLNPDSRAINTQLIPGRTIEAKTNAEGKLLHLEYELRDNNILVAGLTPTGYQVAQQKLVLENHHVLKSATIVSSLFGATDDAGIPDQIALQVADIFSSHIDFSQDLRPGDKFNVIYEAFYNGGELMKTGKVLAAEFSTRGKNYQAVHFGDSDSKYSYYTPEGKSLHKSFLRSPLEFTRVSSSFNPGRYHPVLHRVRAHKGVDLAARSGTRIKATGGGVIAFRGRKGGYGNVIQIKHNNNITTIYGHLSKFAKGVVKGSNVEQGDIIGYVGMTGLATGPHLHYEFLLRDKHRDPMKVDLPTSKPIKAKYKKEFNKKSLAMMAKIEMLNRNLLTANKN